MSELVVVRGDENAVELHRAALRVTELVGGRVVVAGGFAVTCRLARAHRATVDVDTLVEEATPSVLDVLTSQPDIAADPRRGDRLQVGAVTVDVVPTTPVDDADGLDSEHRLFVLAHRFGFESADPLRVVIDTGVERADGDLVVASAPSLVAMKLSSIRDRRRAPEKQASDAYDVYRLLVERDEHGGVARALAAAGEPLRRAVEGAARSILVDDATRSVRPLKVHGSAVMAETTVDDFVFVGERFLDGLSAR